MRTFTSLNFKNIFVTLLLVLSCVFPSVGQKKEGPECTIEIVSPGKGEHVGVTASIQGKAHIPEGKDLWVFVHVKGLALWWPQGAGPAQVENGEWEVLATFGGDQDIGRNFEVAVAVLEQTETKELLQWFKKGEETGKYPGMPIPSVVRGCPIPTVVVNKSR